MTTLAAEARKGDVKVEVYTSDKGEWERLSSLVGKRHGPSSATEASFFDSLGLGISDNLAGIVVRPMTEDEFLQVEEDRLCLYRNGIEGDIHFVCYNSIQQFEADFTQHLGIVSPAAAIYVKAVIAGVQSVERTLRPPRKIGQGGQLKKTGIAAPKPQLMCNSKSVGISVGCCHLTPQ